MFSVCVTRTRHINDVIMMSSSSMRFYSSVYYSAEEMKIQIQKQMQMLLEDIWLESASGNIPVNDFALTRTTISINNEIVDLSKIPMKLIIEPSLGLGQDKWQTFQEIKQLSTCPPSCITSHTITTITYNDKIYRQEDQIIML